MGSSVTVRLSAVFMQECAFFCDCILEHRCVWLPLLYSNMSNLALIPNKFAVQDECASWFMLYVSCIRCGSFDPEAPSSELKIPK